MKKKLTKLLLLIITVIIFTNSTNVFAETNNENSAITSVESYILLNAELAVDNSFNLYISTSDTEKGTLILSGNEYTKINKKLNYGLSKGKKYYIHVECKDIGGSAAFIGRFELNGIGLKFNNGNKVITTDTNTFKVSKTGFGKNYENPTISTPLNSTHDYAGSILDPAKWIWTNNDANCTRYFSAEIIPEELFATATSENMEVDLSWTSISNTISYSVGRSTMQGGPYTTIASGITSQNYIDKDYINDITYYYIITANLPNDESMNSNEVSATVKEDTPSPVTNLAAMPGDSQINLSWIASEGAISYVIKRSTTPGGPYTTIATGSAITYTDYDVTAGTTYYYVVSAMASGKESANSNEASAIPTVTPSPNTLKVVLEVDEQLQLSVDDDLDINTEMIWTASDNTVVTIDENGIVTAMAPGNSVITVTSEDGTYMDYINILVVDDADNLRLAVDLKVGKSCRLTVDDLTDTVNATWTSIDPAVATVTSKGKVKAVSKGLTLVIATDDQENEIGQVYIRVRE